VATTLPFTDVAGNVFFCQIAEAFFSGLTNGTSATTYSPSDSVPREQMAAFVTRTQDSALRRSSRRAALNLRWTPQSAPRLGLTLLNSAPNRVQSDGADLWVSTQNTLLRVRASDGRLTEIRPGLPFGRGVLVAMGKVFVVGNTSPGTLFQIDPTQPPAAVSAVGTTTPLLNGTDGIAFDGDRIWIGSASGGISIVTPSGSPWTSINATTGFTSPRDLVFDGMNMWATDFGTDKLFELNSNGVIIKTVTVGSNPLLPAFDGANIWVPNYGADSVSVVRATGSLAGTVLATLTGNGLNHPSAIAFNGERMLVTDELLGDVSLFKAADFFPLGTIHAGPSTVGVCSDGINFWIALFDAGELARF